jgi:hypothetical protein
MQNVDRPSVCGSLGGARSGSNFKFKPCNSEAWEGGFNNIHKFAWRLKPQLHKQSPHKADWEQILTRVGEAMPKAIRRVLFV